MNIVFWFGSCEEEQRAVVREKIEEIIKDIILENWTKSHYEVIDSEFKEEFLKRFKFLEVSIKKEYDKANQQSPRPERYYHIDFGQDIAFGYANVFVKIKFWHINSRHPFSPDGVALMEYNETYTFDLEEIFNHIKF